MVGGSYLRILGLCDLGYWVVIDIYFYIFVLGFMNLFVGVFVYLIKGEILEIKSDNFYYCGKNCLLFEVCLNIFKDDYLNKYDG